MSKNEITIFLRFAPVEQLYECTVNASSSFHQILETLKPMIQRDLEGIFSLDQKLYVFARYDETECDPDVSLRSMNIQNGMEFLIL